MVGIFTHIRQYFVSMGFRFTGKSDLLGLFFTGSTPGMSSLGEYLLTKVGHKSGIILTTCIINITLMDARDFLESNTIFALLVKISVLQVSKNIFC